MGLLWLSLSLRKHKKPKVRHKLTHSWLIINICSRTARWEGWAAPQPCSQQSQAGQLHQSRLPWASPQGKEPQLASFSHKNTTIQSSFDIEALLSHQRWKLKPCIDVLWCMMGLLLLLAGQNVDQMLTEECWWHAKQECLWNGLYCHPSTGQRSNNNHQSASRPWDGK